MSGKATYDNLGLVGDIQRKIEELEISIKALRKTGAAYAQAEKDYKIKLRQKVLEDRANNTAVGIISMTIYGEPEVAELRFKRDVALATYEANKEHINATKLEIKILDSQYKQEFGGNLSD